MKKNIQLIIFCLLYIANTNAQRQCGSAAYYQTVIKSFPEIAKRIAFARVPDKAVAADDGKTINIPVVIHSVYNNETERITMEQIQTQLTVLNRDFAGKTPGYSNIPERFREDTAGDCKIVFFLADTTWTKTTKKEFRIDFNRETSEENDPIKFTRLGGKDGYPSDKFLNLWVGNIQGGGYAKDSLFGYTTPPKSINKFDGVVIHYKYFGMLNTSYPYNLGKTVTHEVGHWLNLLHISGDGTSNACGTDLVDDTPTQGEQNTRCPQGIKKNCTNDAKGEMYMNYMDYVDDECMYMFSKKQKERIRNCFFGDGIRKSFKFVPDIDRSYHGIEGGWVFLNLPIVLDVIQKANETIINWEGSRNAENYTILIKKVKDTNWKLTETVHYDRIKVTGLQAGALYEFKVKVHFTSNKELESPAYIFIADKSLNKNLHMAAGALNFEPVL